MNVLFWSINCVIALILLYLKVLFSRRKLYEIAAKIPGPPAFPLIGAMYLFFGKDNESVLPVIDDLLNKYKSPAKAWLGPMLILLMDSPEDLKIVLNSPNCLQKAYPYNFLGVSKGLMAAPADIWKTHRKYLNPCFNPKLLQSFIPIFNEKCKNLADRMAIKLNQAEFDIYHFVGRCTLDMICGTAMGLDYDLQTPEGGRYLENADVVAESVNRRIFNIFMHPQQIYKFTKNFQIEERGWRGMRTITAKVVDSFNRKMKKLESIDENNNENKEKIVEKTNENLSDLRKPKIFVDQVFEMARTIKEFDEQSITDEIDTLIAGGNETSGLTVSFTVLMLAMHQDIQERVVSELRTIFDSVNQPVTVEAIQKLEYLSMVINETLRLFPITPLIGREVKADVQLQHFLIPAGASIFIPIYKIHRNKSTWGEDSHRFNPDNFLPENIEKRHPYSYLPFSHGSRNCIGMKYSLLAMKIMLCYMLRRYKFTTNLKYSELRFKMCLDLKIANKHMVMIEPRHF